MLNTLLDIWLTSLHDRKFMSKIWNLFKSLFFFARMFISLGCFNYFFPPMYVFGSEKSREVPHQIFILSDLYFLFGTMVITVGSAAASDFSPNCCEDGLVCISKILFVHYLSSGVVEGQFRHEYDAVRSLSRARVTVTGCTV